MLTDEKNINETKNVNVHNPVQINIGQSENSLQTVINFIKNLELIKVNSYLKQFIKHYITTGMVAVPLIIFCGALFLTLFMAFMGYHQNGYFGIESFLVVPKVIHALISSGILVEFIGSISPLIMIYVCMLISIYVTSFIAGKIYFYDNPEKAKALRDILFCLVGAYFIVGFTKHVSDSMNNNKKE